MSREDMTLLTIKDLCEMFKIGKSTLYTRILNQPGAPSPIVFGPQDKRSKVLFRKKDIEDYLERVANRNTNEAKNLP